MICVAVDVHPGVGENRLNVSQRDFSPELGCADVYSISPVCEASVGIGYRGVKCRSMILYSESCPVTAVI